MDLQQYLRKLASLKELPDTVAFLCSLALFVLAFIDFAYFPNPSEQSQINFLYRTIWIIFLLELTLRIIFKYKVKSRRGMVQKIVITGLLYSTLIPYLFQPTASSFWGTVWSVINHKFYFLFTLSLVGIANIAGGAIKLFNKKTNPALLMAGSFLLLIVLGTFFLLSPRCTQVPISIIDAFFISTSAVCVTGLTPMDIATAFTIEGQVAILLLIQIGGLGVMTLTSFFAVFFMGNIGLYNQITVKELISTGTMHSLLSTLLYILGFTLLIELSGMLAIWLTIHDDLGMTVRQEVFFAAFHAISAFCNAGFSTLTGNLGHPSVMTGQNMLFVIISFLIILGGIGFPILVNLKNLLGYEIRKIISTRLYKQLSFKRVAHIINVNTKIVLITTGLLIVTGTITLAVLEWNGAFANMPVTDKIAHSFFNAVAPRTAGFNSISLTQFSMQSLLIYTFLMWVGGASQSTAGGIKVNTFAVALLSVKSILRSADRVDVFRREISQDSIRRANGTIFISFLVIPAAILVLSFLEPDIPLFHLVFECFSAMGTVGSSLNTTPLLGAPAKLLIALLMFTGRIGIFTLLVSFIAKKPRLNYKFPQEQIIIN